MKRIITSVLVFLFLTGIAYSGDKYIKAEYVSFVGVEQFSNLIKRTVFCVQTKGNQTDDNPNNDWIPVGSGFLVKGDNKHIYGVTCKHVVLKPLEKKKIIYAAIETDKGFRRARCLVDHIDNQYDFAILSPQKKKREMIKMENLTFSLDHFASNDELIEGRALIIPGYPLGIGTIGDENHPVIRMGIIAQYSDKDFFLIDGIASHGNSGSPVFLLKEKKVAGILTSHLSDYISLMDENGRIAARLPYNSGIGRALVGNKIYNALKELTSKK
jgi:S1-C subfamily serine protease